MVIGRRPILPKFKPGPHDRNPDRIQDPVQLGQMRIARDHGDQLMQSRIESRAFQPVGGRSNAFVKAAGPGNVARGGVDRGMSGQYGLKRQARHHGGKGACDFSQVHDEPVGPPVGGQRHPHEIFAAQVAFDNTLCFQGCQRLAPLRRSAKPSNRARGAMVSCQFRDFDGSTILGRAGDGFEHLDIVDHLL